MINGWKPSTKLVLFNFKEMEWIFMGFGEIDRKHNIFVWYVARILTKSAVTIIVKHD